MAEFLTMLPHCHRHMDQVRSLAIQPPPMREGTPTRSWMLRSEENEFIYNVSQYYSEEKAGIAFIMIPSKGTAPAANSLWRGIMLWLLAQSFCVK